MSGRTVVDIGGGYDRGYSACPLFWPNRPGSLLLALERQNELPGLSALDVGCGEGTNAAWLTERGFEVEGIEVSELALDHAQKKYPHLEIRWTLADTRTVDPQRSEHDLVVAYGLLHCIPEPDFDSTLSRLMDWTKVGGLLVLVAFNSRSQDLEQAHAGFEPTLRTHQFYLDAFAGWDLLMASEVKSAWVVYEVDPSVGRVGQAVRA